jgi:hypothetical protein
MSTRNRLVIVGMNDSNDETESEAMLSVLNSQGYRACCGTCGKEFKVCFQSGLVIDTANFVAFAAHRCRCGSVVTNLWGEGPVADEARSAMLAGEFTDGEPPVASSPAMMPM